MALSASMAATRLSPARNSMLMEWPKYRVMPTSPNTIQMTMTSTEPRLAAAAVFILWLARVSCMSSVGGHHRDIRQSRIPHRDHQLDGCANPGILRVNGEINGDADGLRDVRKRHAPRIDPVGAVEIAELQVLDIL